MSGATSYNLYWYHSPGVTKTKGTKIANVTSPYIHTGLTNGTTYYYVVTAANSYAESKESIQVSAGPASTGAPASAIGQAVDNTSLTWTTGGDANWFGQASVYNYGGSAAQSGPIAAGQNSWVQTAVTGPATLSFYWKVDACGSQHLTFSVDGSLVYSISGQVAWQQKTYLIPAGSHTLQWKYSKDAGYSGCYTDAGWLDQVVITP